MDEQVTRMCTNPRYQIIVEDTPEIMTNRIVVDVIQSESCHSQHRVGDRFVLDANGYLLTDELPKRVCLYALAALAQRVAVIHEQMAAHLPLYGPLFDHAQCHDVRPECVGCGRLLMKISVIVPEHV